MGKKLVNIKYKRKDIVEFGGVLTEMKQPLKFTFGVRQVELNDENLIKFKSFVEDLKDEEGNITRKAPYGILIENGDLSFEIFEPKEKEKALKTAAEDVNKINQEDITKAAIVEKINKELNSLREDQTVTIEEIKTQYKKYVEGVHHNTGKDKLLDIIAEKKVEEQLKTFGL